MVKNMDHGLPKFSLLDYDDWKIMMKAHLYALHDCMWMVLEDGLLKIQMENPERNPAAPDVVQYIPKPKEKWDDRDCKKHNLDNVAKAAIFKTLDPITFSKIKHLKTAMEIWQGLGKLCEGSEDLRKQKIKVLLEKFKSFKMLPGESFDMLDERFHKILNDLASLNHILSPKEKNVRTYEHELKKKKEEQVTPFPTTLMTTSRIPSSEGTCTRNCDTPSSSQPSSSKMENYDEEFAMMVKQFRKFKKFFKKADSIRRPSKGKPQVEKYGERERIEKKKKAMVAAESDESSSSSSDEEALVCMEHRVEKSNHEDRWTMSEDDNLCLMAKDDADQEFKKMMKDFEEINLKHSSLTEENKLLSEENLKLTESRKSQLNEITQLKTENESLSEKEAAKYPGVWYLDSGCSRHMTGDASLLSNLIPYDGGSNDFGLTKGLGILVYKGLTIQAVSYVEGLNYNLLSISQFCDKGYSLEFCKDMASLKNISTNEVILTGKRIRNIYEVIWNDVKEACLISKGKQKAECDPGGRWGEIIGMDHVVDKTSKHDHEVLDLSDKDEEINEGDRMKPTEFIPFRSLPLKTSQRNPDSNSAEPTGNLGQPSNIPDHSIGDNSGNGDPVPIHPETPTSVLKPEAELDQPVNPNQHNLRWLRDHPPQQVIGDIQSGVRTRSAQQNLEAMLAFLELVIACLECGSGGHADDITQERAFIINALITKSKVNWAAHFFNSISKHLGKPNQKYLCQGLYIGHILESLGAASEGKNYEARYWLYYQSSKGENRAGASTTAEESSSDNVLIMSLNKSVKRKQVVSPSPSAEAPQNLAPINLEEEEEFSDQGELQSKKKRKITSPSISGYVNPDELKEKETTEETSAHNRSPQQLEEDIPQVQNSPTSSQPQVDDVENQFWQLYYDWRAWKVGNSAKQLLSWDQQLKNEKIIKKCLGLPVNYCCEQILDVDWVWQRNYEDLHLEHLVTSPISEFEVDDEDPAVYKLVLSKTTEDQVVLTSEAQVNLETTAEDFQIFPETSSAFETVLPEAAVSTPQKQNQEGSNEELQQALEILTNPCEITNPTETEIPEKSAENLEMSKTLKTNEAQEEQVVEAQRSSAKAEKETQMAELEASKSPVAIFETQNEAEERDSLSRDISNFTLREAEEESERTLKINDEEYVQDDAESLPMQLFQRTPSSHQVTNFHFHSSSIPTLPDEVPEIWSKKVQGLIESALASQHASFRQEIEQMEARHNKLIEKSEETQCSNLKEISKSVDKTLEILSLLSNTVSNTMETYASDSYLQLKEVNKIREQIATVTVSLQKQMSILQMDIRAALAVSSANQVVTKDYLKVIIDNKKEAHKLFKLLTTNSGNRKMEVVLQQHSPSLILELPIAVKEGEVSYIPTHLNLTDLVLEAQRSNPENSTQCLSCSGLDGTEAVGTIAAHFSNENQTEERRNNIRRIKELCGSMQGIREIAESSKRKKH
ncbi:unnamed protein product [Cuscuta campestris]|uniref:Retrovirus-related Pol polyprotein from transposon TNT 1-94-like beta-barrel domain-containing protein n=1 Tax=Cuscuta campestris TaxID=132261 RepID=A0A484MEV8_9ASTE|nr:unnamed protein product [Cuscuta campestris]